MSSFSVFQALVAEVDIKGHMTLTSDKKTEGRLEVKNLSVFSTSLKTEESHLRHQVGSDRQSESSH